MLYRDYWWYINVLCNEYDSYTLIATAFSTALIMLSGQFQHKAVTKLQKLYKKNGNEKVLYKEKI